MTAAQPSPPTSFASSFPISASSLRPLRLSVIFDPSCLRPFVFILLRTLFLSLRSFPRFDRLFSIACRLFSQNTGGVWGVILSVLSVSQWQIHFVKSFRIRSYEKRPRKSFRIRSYKNTRGVGAPPGTLSGRTAGGKIDPTDGDHRFKRKTKLRMEGG